MPYHFHIIPLSRIQESFCILFQLHLLITNQVPLDQVNGIKPTWIVLGKPKIWSTSQDDDQVATKQNNLLLH